MKTKKRIKENKIRNNKIILKMMIMVINGLIKCLKKEIKEEVKKI
jgi:hypothetical protein